MIHSEQKAPFGAFFICKAFLFNSRELNVSIKDEADSKYKKIYFT
jgi:hypothetical protein